MGKDTTLKQYIKAFVKMFSQDGGNPIAAGFYKWLLKEGNAGKTKKFTKKELAQLKVILKGAGVQPRAKQCYYVSQLMAMAAHDNTKVKYMEGFAVLTIPVEHAWLEFNGKVVDTVWGCLEHNQSPDGFSADPQCEYYGVEIPYDMVATNLLRSHKAESLLQQLYLERNKK